MAGLVRLQRVRGIGRCRRRSPLSAAATGVEEGAYPVTIGHKYGETTITSRTAARRHRRPEGAGRLHRPGRGPGRARPPGSTSAAASCSDRGPRKPSPARPSRRSSPTPTASSSSRWPPCSRDLIIGVYSRHEAGRLREADRAGAHRRSAGEVPGVGRPLWMPRPPWSARPWAARSRWPRLIEDAKKRVKVVKESNPEFGGLDRTGRHPVGRASSSYGSQDPRGRLLTDLGFSMPPDLDKAIEDAWGGDLSDENVELLDVDALVWLVEGKGRQDDRGQQGLRLARRAQGGPRGLHRSRATACTRRSPS